MTKQALIAAAMAALLTGPATAREPVWTGTTVECREWAETRAWLQNDREGYLLGLLDGLSLGTWTEFWRAGGTKISHKQVFLWMDEYCRDEPLSDVTAGALLLYKERVGHPVHPAQR